MNEHIFVWKVDRRYIYYIKYLFLIYSFFTDVRNSFFFLWYSGTKIGVAKEEKNIGPE